MRSSSRSAAAASSRPDPVAQAGCVLEALLAPRAGGAAHGARAGRRRRRPTRGRRAPARPSREAAAGERPEARRLGAHRPARAAAAEVHVAIGARAACVRGRPQLAEQPELLQRRLELGAGHAPVHPLQRPERRLDCGPLALAGEVRAKASAQVAGPTDVEREPAASAEDVHPRSRGAPRRASASS